MPVDDEALLVRQRSRDLLGWTRQHVGDRNGSRLLEICEARGLIEEGWTYPPIGLYSAWQ